MSSNLHSEAHSHPGWGPGVVVKYPSRKMTPRRVVNAPRDQTAQVRGPAGPLFFGDNLWASFTPPLEAGVPVILPVAFVQAPIQPGLSSEIALSCRRHCPQGYSSTAYPPACEGLPVSMVTASAVNVIPAP